MKNRVFGFLKKYRFCFLLNLIMIVGMFLSTIFADLYTIGGDIIHFNLRDLYFILGLPLYSLIYGCLSYVKIKKVWAPQLILCSLFFLYIFTYWCLTRGINALVIIMSLGAVICSAILVVFSLIGTGITKFVYYIIKESGKT